MKRRVTSRNRKRIKTLGCLKEELVGHSVTNLMDELRGPVKLPPASQKGKDS
jgi:hypothetical protein